jgi:hypothetical protein
MVKDIVIMPRHAYLSEHHKLTKLLDTTGKALLKESNNQKKEVKDERRKHKAIDPKSK